MKNIKSNQTSANYHEDRSLFAKVTFKNHEYAEAAIRILYDFGYDYRILDVGWHNKKQQDQEAEEE